jgi:hypothetical protein
MPAAVAVSGRARTASAWPNLVEQLVSEPTTNWRRRGTRRSVQELEGRSATGPAVRGPSLAAPTLTAATPVAAGTFSRQRAWATPGCS